jgi:hypothetical protein
MGSWGLVGVKVNTVEVNHGRRGVGNGVC